MNIAVIGGGVAGIVSAYLLSRKHNVTLFEKNGYVGGHTNTIVIEEGPDKGLAVDTGFIVLNDTTYPLFHTFLSQLKVPTRYSDMNFSIYCKKSGLQYASRNLDVLFAQRANIFSPRYLRFVIEMPLFWRVARKALLDKSCEGQTMGQFLARFNFSQKLKEDFLAPLGAAIWSCSAASIDDFPADTFLRFFHNHGFLGYFNQPRWQTVVGGSFSYVKAFLASFAGTVVTNTQIKHIRRSQNTATIDFMNMDSRQYDHVILATHADEALQLLADPGLEERRLLGAWSYSKNETYLHTDIRFMPPMKKVWASWNYLREKSDSNTQPLSMTYYMNNLQGFHAQRDYCVTLNPRIPVDPAHIIKTITYTHPLYSPQAVATQPKIRALSGTNNTWYCGNYLGYGFHEDAVRSSVEMAEKFGIVL